MAAGEQRFAESEYDLLSVQGGVAPRRGAIAGFSGRAPYEADAVHAAGWLRAAPSQSERWRAGIKRLGAWTIPDTPRAKTYLTATSSGYEYKVWYYVE